MKSALLPVLVCAFLQVIWLSISTGQGTDGCDISLNQTACCILDNCTLYGCRNSTTGDGRTVCVLKTAVNSTVCPTGTTVSDNQCLAASDDPCKNVSAADCCFSPNNCTLYNCTSAAGNDAQQVCVSVSTNETEVCLADMQPTNMCTADDPCSSYGEDDCCSDEANACALYNCTITADNSTTSYCVSSNSSTFQCPSNSTQSGNLCTPVTTSPPTPITPASTDPCLTLTNLSTCCANQTSQCVFHNCTDTAGKNTSICISANTSVAANCPANTTMSPSICPVNPPPTTTAGPTTPSPTKSPSTGGDSGGQHFDAASFIGGIVLCAGLVAIGYFGLKFYRSRQDRNYHTL